MIFLKLPPSNLAGFDLMTHSSSLPGAAETIPPGHAAKALLLFIYILLNDSRACLILKFLQRSLFFKRE
jgi:hypothetical protein